MKQKWLNLILHISSAIHGKKNNLLFAGLVNTIILGLQIIFLEILLLIISLPAYFFITPDENTDTFNNNAQQIKVYRLRRKMTFAVLAIFLTIIIVKGSILFSGFVTFPSNGQASSSAWNFTNPKLYSFNKTFIELKGGAIVFEPPQNLNKITTDVVLNTSTISAKNAVNSNTAIKNIPVATSAPASPAITTTSTVAFRKKPRPRRIVADFGDQCSATIQSVDPLEIYDIQDWTGFEEDADKGTGQITYQISLDNGKNWLYNNGTEWQKAGANNANTAAEINKYVFNLPTDDAQVLFKAIFTNDCSQNMSLMNLGLHYRSAPRKDRVISTSNKNYS